PSKRRELLCHCLDVTLPAGRRTRRLELGLVGGLAGQRDAELGRDGQHEPAAVVGVLADQVDAARSAEARHHATLNVMKVTLVGAGSTVFARTLIGDLLSYPELADGLTLALMDIDEERLRVTERASRALDPNVRVEATLDRRAALDGADY